MTVEEKETLLLKANYTAKDVMFLANVAHTQATKIMNECRVKYGGAVAGRMNVIKAKSFWEREGTTIEEELRLLSIAKYGYQKLP